MSTQVLRMHRVFPRVDRSWAAFAAVYLAARRLGHAQRAALRAARAAHAAVASGRTSAAGAIAALRRDLRQTAGSAR